MLARKSHHPEHIRPKHPFTATAARAARSESKMAGQSSLLQTAVPAPSAPEGQRLDALTDSERRSRECERLGLAWPQPKQKPGDHHSTTSGNALCVKSFAALSGHSWTDKVESLPQWWRPGAPLHQTLADFVEQVPEQERQEGQAQASAARSREMSGELHNNSSRSQIRYCLRSLSVPWMRWSLKRIRNFPVTPTPTTFRKVLPYKWEA